MVGYALLSPFLFLLAFFVGRRKEFDGTPEVLMWCAVVIPFVFMLIFGVFLGGS